MSGSSTSHQQILNLLADLLVSAGKLENRDRAHVIDGLKLLQTSNPKRITWLKKLLQEVAAVAVECEVCGHDPHVKECRVMTGAGIHRIACGCQKRETAPEHIRCLNCEHSKDKHVTSRLGDGQLVCPTSVFRPRR